MLIAGTITLLIVAQPALAVSSSCGLGHGTQNVLLLLCRVIHLEILSGRITESRQLGALCEARLARQ